MTKQEILDKFSDIDFAYNDSSKHETLSRMLDELLKEQQHKIWELNEINEYLDDVKKDQEHQIDVLKEQPQIVRCKDCKHRGKSEKCVLAAISEEKDFPIFMLDNRGEWFCADGVRKND